MKRRNVFDELVVVAGRHEGRPKGKKEEKREEENWWDSRLRTRAEKVVGQILPRKGQTLTFSG
jgi:hypothetical protein